MKRVSTVIRNIKRGAPVTGKDGQRRPGNIIVNDDGLPNDTSKRLWFSSVEWRNLILGAEILPVETPIGSFVGARISYDVLEITPKMLEDNGGEYKITIRGREVIFKKPGISLQNLDIDWNTVNVDERYVNIMKVKQMFPGQRVQAPAQPALPARPATTDAIEEVEEVEEVVELNGNDTAEEPLTGGETVKTGEKNLTTATIQA